jgi:hypothetical protein
MITKHFFKIMAIFVGMIVLGLIGVILINYFDQSGINEVVRPNNPAPVAK